MEDEVEGEEVLLGYLDAREFLVLRKGGDWDTPEGVEGTDEVAEELVAAAGRVEALGPLAHPCI